MAVLPGEDWLIQQVGSVVILYHRHSEEEIVRFDPTDHPAVARAQETIFDDPRLNAEQKSFAHFWSGYFYAHAR